MADVDSLARARGEDWELLRAFFEEGSEEAFGELVGRHVKGVYAHARRVLGDRHMAEDVTQAVFLLLAQKGRGIPERAVLVGWLYKVTQFACANAKRVEARRARHERKAALMKEVATEEVGLSEEEVHVDRIVGGLAARGRDALLMKYVEGRTVTEIGRMMGCSAAAAEKRVQRALEKVRGRFAAMGIESPAGIKAVEVLGAGMVPAALSGMAVRGALSGGASPAVVHLAKGTAMMMWMAKAKVAAAVLAVVLTVGIGGILWAQKNLPSTAVEVSAVSAAPAAAFPAMTAGTRADMADVITVRGTVFDPSGKPMANAKVSVPAAFNWGTQFVGRPARQTMSGADGHYELTYSKGDVSAFSDGMGADERETWKTVLVIASADHCGPAWERWDHADASGNVDLHLVADDVPIEGRVLDARGKPVAGVSLLVDTIIDGIDLDLSKPLPKDSLRNPFSAVGRDAAIVSDAEGRFRIEGIGRERHVFIQAVGLHAAFTRFEANTRVMPTQVRIMDQPSGDQTRYVTYGAHFDFTAADAMSVEGVVRDAATEKPVAGVPVKSFRFGGPFFGLSGEGRLGTVTDAEGRYRLDGFYGEGGNALIVVPTDTQPYFLTVKDVGVPIGGGPAHVDVEIHGGVFVTGKVTDKVTGEPVPCTMICGTYQDNEHTLDVPEFHELYRDYSNQLKYETKPDGTYRVVAVPGKAIIEARCEQIGYLTGVGCDQIPAFQSKHFSSLVYMPVLPATLVNAVKEIEIAEGAASATADLQVERGLTVHVHVVDAAGKPAPGCMVTENRVQSYRSAADSFDVVGISPNERRGMIVIDEARQLGRGRIFTSADAADGNLLLQLQPLATVTGHCILDDGKPAANVSLEVFAGAYLPQISTDAEGRFKCRVPTGEDLYVKVFGGPFAETKVVIGLTLEPGEAKDVGDVWMDLLRR